MVFTAIIRLCKLMKAFSSCVFSHVVVAELILELVSNSSEDGHHLSSSLSPKCSLGWRSLDERCNGHHQHQWRKLWSGKKRKRLTISRILILGDLYFNTKVFSCVSREQNKKNFLGRNFHMFCKLKCILFSVLGWHTAPSAPQTKHVGRGFTLWWQWLWS